MSGGVKRCPFCGSNQIHNDHKKVDGAFTPVTVCDSCEAIFKVVRLNEER